MQYVRAIMVQQESEGTRTLEPTHVLRVLPVETTCAATLRDILEAVTPLIARHFPGHPSGERTVCLHRATCWKKTCRFLPPARSSFIFIPC